MFSMVLLKIDKKIFIWIFKYVIFSVFMHHMFHFLPQSDDFCADSCYCEII